MATPVSSSKNDEYYPYPCFQLQPSPSWCCWRVWTAARTPASTWCSTGSCPADWCAAINVIWMRPSRRSPPWSAPCTSVSRACQTAGRSRESLGLNNTEKVIISENTMSEQIYKVFSCENLGWNIGYIVWFYWDISNFHKLLFCRLVNFFAVIQWNAGELL